MTVGPDGRPRGETGQHDHGQKVAGTMIPGRNKQYLLESVRDHEEDSKLSTIMVAGAGRSSMITARTGNWHRPLLEHAPRVTPTTELVEEPEKYPVQAAIMKRSDRPGPARLAQCPQDGRMSPSDTASIYPDRAVTQHDKGQGV
jgi:hypothetical protein